MANDNARRYSIGRPLQNVRLRNWPAGRVAQLKTAIQRLENILNSSAATQIEQPAKREISSRIPKVTTFTVRAGVRNFHVSITDPQGITDLLFYEVQHDTSPVFSNPSTIVSPTNTVSVGGVTPGSTRYARVRAVNSRFQAGIWSDTRTFTVAAFRINTTRFGRGDEVSISSSSFDVWTTLATASYTASGGSVSVISHISMRPDEPILLTDGHVITTQATGEFRVLRDGVQVTNSGVGRICTKSTAEGNVDDAQDSVISCTLVTPFETLEGGTYTYTVQAQIVSAHSVRRREIGGVPSFLTLNPVKFYSELLDIVEVVSSA